MHVNPNDSVAITVKSSNSSDPALALKWRPQAGVTDITITFTNSAGDKEVRSFKVDREKHP